MKLNRGLNLGGYLSQCVHEDAHYRTFIQDSDIIRISEQGFDHVRLPIDYEVLENADGTPKPAGYAYVDHLADLCEGLGMQLVIDLHKAPGYDFNNAGDAEKNNLFTDTALQQRFIHLWQEIAARYGSRQHIIFELLNEVVEKENADAWNHLIDACLDAIREITPDTPVIYGGIQWNSAKTLKYLNPPKHKNIIFTFHFYEPLLFTHQKAYWVAGMSPDTEVPYPATMEYFREHSLPLGYQGEVAAKANAKTMGTEFILEMIEEAVSAAETAGVPLYCGEFGVIDRAPLEDTYRWFADVDSVFRRFDIGCAVWNYKEKDFGLTDAHYAPIFDRLVSLWTNE